VHEFLREGYIEAGRQETNSGQKPILE